MSFLVDTNVISELRKPEPHGGVLAWITRVPEEALYLSVVTLAEIQSGIELTREQDPSKAEALECWLDDVAASWNVLDIDAAVARRSARLMHRQPDHHLEDALIAATALVFDMKVATRNVADFRRFGVQLVNPFSSR
ncbi:MAG TPA: type II toxin-antitoxin system VapC family toxin [Woeseiaceae bacterium]